MGGVRTSRKSELERHGNSGEFPLPRSRLPSSLRLPSSGAGTFPLSPDRVSCAGPSSLEFLPGRAPFPVNYGPVPPHPRPTDSNDPKTGEVAKNTNGTRPEGLRGPGTVPLTEKSPEEGTSSVGLVVGSLEPVSLTPVRLLGSRGSVPSERRHCRTSVAVLTDIYSAPEPTVPQGGLR